MIARKLHRRCCGRRPRFAETSVVDSLRFPSLTPQNFLRCIRSDHGRSEQDMNQMLQGVSEKEKQRLMVMLEEMQMKEQVTMYNSLVERCFANCVTSFRGKNLDEREEKCVRRCPPNLHGHHSVNARLNTCRSLHLSVSGVQRSLSKHQRARGRRSRRSVTQHRARHQCRLKLRRAGAETQHFWDSERALQSHPSKLFHLSVFNARSSRRILVCH